MDALQNATIGMTNAVSQLDAAASRVAGAGPVDDRAYAQAAVDLAQSKAQFAANVAVVRVADQMMGALLDITT